MSTSMKCDLSGVLRNAADQMDELAREVRSAAGWTENEVVDDPANMADYYAFVLREIAGHAEDVAAGKHAITEFADHYCLSRKSATVSITKTLSPLPKPPPNVLLKESESRRRPKTS